jgi:hypothetical protein
MFAKQMSLPNSTHLDLFSLMSKFGLSPNPLNFAGAAPREDLKAMLEPLLHVVDSLDGFFARDPKRFRFGSIGWRLQ